MFLRTRANRPKYIESLFQRKRYFVLLLLLVAVVYGVEEYYFPSEFNLQQGNTEEEERFQDFPPIPMEATKLNEYFQQVLKIQHEACGRLCSFEGVNFSIPQYPAEATVLTRHTVQNLLNDYIEKPVNCPHLYRKDVERVLETSGPHFSFVPEPLFSDYSFEHRVKLCYSGSCQSHNLESDKTKTFSNSGQNYLGSEAHVSDWSFELIESMRQELRKTQLTGSYSVRATNNLFNFIREVGIINMKVLVIGSERPWVEAICLEAGAKEVVTLEYGKISSSHPQVKTYVPSEFNDRFRRQDKTLLFDVIVSFSSLEHSGLGRYGDGLNP